MSDSNEQGVKTEQPEPAGMSPKASFYLEIYRITAENFTRLLKPVGFVLVVVLFGSTVETVLSNVSELEIAGFKLKIVDKILSRAAEAEDEAHSPDDKIALHASRRVVENFGMRVSSRSLKKYLGWDETAYQNKQNHNRLNEWLDFAGISRDDLEAFLNNADYADERVKAIDHLELQD